MVSCRLARCRWSLGVAATLLSLWASTARADNVIQIENAKAGTTAWQITSPTVNQEIEGYGSLTSVNRGGQISFFVNTSESSYTLEVYRTGWYGGTGGRRLLNAVTRTGVQQPIPQPDPTTGLIECNWTAPYVLTIPSSPSDPSDPAYWASGVYLVKLTALTSGRQRYITFVVRDDARPSDYLFQSGVNTHQAYNTWGGRDLYTTPQARKVSFNRPQALYDGAGLFKYWELSVLRFLEREGYDVSYCTDVDTHENGNLLLSHRGYLSVSHDEYWSLAMRTNVEAARDLGVGLAFLDANSCYWQIRFEASALTGAPDRTIVCYKQFAQTEDPIALDGDPTNDYLETTQWRLSPVNRPEDGFIGVMYLQGNFDSDFVVEDPTHWVYSGTGVVAGERLPGLIGSEADRMYGHSSPSTARFGHSPLIRPAGVSSFPPVDYGDAVSYVAPSGAPVVGIGSIQWGWGLDDQGVPTDHTSRLNPAAQQMTHNILTRIVERSGIPGSSVTLSATASPQPVVQGGTVTFVLSVKNQGSSSLTNVVVTDALPSGLTFQSASTTLGSCGPATGSVSCSLGTLGASATATITIVVTANQAGTAETTIGVAADQSQAANNLVKLARVIPAGFSPAFGSEGSLVSIYGSSLGSATAVKFNGTSSPFTVNSSSQVTTRVPAGATNGTLTVTTSGGTSSLGTFVVTPRVTGFSPLNGPSGTTVTINGTSFTGATFVRFNGASAASFTVNSPTQITAVVQPGATTGKVSVVTPNGPGGKSVAVSSAGYFSITAASVSGFSPANGAAGTTVTVTGAGFTGASAVYLNDRSASFTFISDTQLTFVVPPNATSGLISLNSTAGTTYSPSGFTVTTPALSFFSPSAGPAGTPVFIDGGNLTGTSSVKFNGVAASFSLLSSTRLMATVPAGGTSGTITITTPGGTATSAVYGAQPGTFTVIGPPTITSFSPTSGSVGSAVVLTGTNLTGATSVRFNGVSATAFTVNSATQITATVPSGATTGTIGVTSPMGAATSATSFTVGGSVPAITSFNPTSGPVGTSVVITGTNLTGATAVKFNGTSATTFTVNSATQITATVPSGATTGTISVTTPGGTGTSASTFTVTAAAPTITSFSPTSGPVGTSVVITGTNLTGATAVKFNGTSATTFTVNSATQITATVPSGATTGTISVTTPGGTGTSASSFTVTGAVPTITSFSPSSGPVGTSVVITGTNLTGATAVKFNGTSATTFTVNSATQITATVPSGATTGTISVTTAGGTGTSASTFTVTAAAPTITSFSPTSGPVGTSVVITGTNLTGATAVKFNGTSATTFTVNSSTQITATVPSGATTGTISVTTPGGTGTSASSFTVTGAAPTITSFSPTGGPVGTSVTITGTNLTGATSVKFNGTSATTFTVNSSTQITATVPSGATTGTITVTTPGGTATSASNFTVGAPPTIASFTPQAGPAGASVVIGGTNFGGATAVAFHGTGASSFHVDSSTQITATVPTGATTGTLSVTTPAGTATSTSSFTIGPAPVISNVQPSAGGVGDVIAIVGSDLTGVTGVTFNGTSAAFFTINSATRITATVPLAGTTGRIALTASDGSAISPTDFVVTAFSPVIGPVGTSVTIRGSNFTGATSVNFGGVAATFTVDSDSQIRATVPSGAPTGPVVVTAPGGTFTTPTDFTVTAFSPLAGPVGATVTILGSNFTGATSVTFDGVSASFTVNSDTKVTATVPLGASTGPIVVTAPGGTFTSPTDFTVTPFSPSSGPAGTVVTIFGSGFTGATGVDFDGVAASFTVNSDSQVTATVPSGSTTGPITVTTPQGSSTSTDHFAVTSPAITSFSPSGGNVGTTVVVTGANFTGATSVQFNNTQATFTVDAKIQITAVVPGGATNGPIRVSTPAGIALSQTSFAVTSPTITSFSPTSGPVGTSVVITGTNLTGATAVKFHGTSATTFTVNSATQITATVPGGATTGTITVTTPGGTATSSSNFTVTAAVPTITSFAPTSGPPGTLVTITGTNLTGASSVKFNGANATAFTVDSATQITATVPNNATTGTIQVTTPGGTAASASSFTVAPAITNFTPASGPVGTNVVINGTNLTGATSVQFNGTSATAFTVNSATRITATVPSGATTGTISVTTPGGTATSTNSFTVKPAITSFSPTSGPVGTTVVITGTSLSGATSVKFHNTSATVFTVNSSTQITATVPAGATNGKIKVTTPGGTAQSQTNFQVQ